jgi:hypothetical protein
MKAVIWAIGIILFILTSGAINRSLSSTMRGSNTTEKSTLKSTLKTSGKLAAKPSASIAAKLAQAKEMVLEGNKQEALAFLLKTYQSGGLEGFAKTSSRLEFLRGWEELANLFLTDKAQNSFSLAESVWMSRPKEALDFLKTASQQETENLQIAILGARAALRIRDCTKAEYFSKEANKIFVPGAEVRLIALQVKLCGLQPSAPLLGLKLASEVGESWGEIESAARALLVADLWRRGDIAGSKSALSTWEQHAPSDPEMWYWKWKVSGTSSSENESLKNTNTSNGGGKSRDSAAARNYLRLCNEMTPRKRKILSIHPELCLWIENVESDLKSREKQGL